MEVDMELWEGGMRVRTKRATAITEERKQLSAKLETF